MPLYNVELLLDQSGNVHRGYPDCDYDVMSLRTKIVRLITNLDKECDDNYGIDDEGRLVDLNMDRSYDLGVKIVNGYLLSEDTMIAELDGDRVAIIDPSGCEPNIEKVVYNIRFISTAGENGFWSVFFGIDTLDRWVYLDLTESAIDEYRTLPLSIHPSVVKIPEYDEIKVVRGSSILALQGGFYHIYEVEDIDSKPSLRMTTTITAELGNIDDIYLTEDSILVKSGHRMYDVTMGCGKPDEYCQPLLDLLDQAGAKLELVSLIDRSGEFNLNKGNVYAIDQNDNLYSIAEDSVTHMTQLKVESD